MKINLVRFEIFCTEIFARAFQAIHRLCQIKYHIRANERHSQSVSGTQRRLTRENMEFVIISSAEITFPMLDIPQSQKDFTRERKRTNKPVFNIFYKIYVQFLSSRRSLHVMQFLLLENFLFPFSLYGFFLC